MSRFVVGVTLTPEERAARNLLHTGTRSQSPPRLMHHELNVALPDGSSCPVRYRRFAGRSHRFLFGEPLTEAVWVTEPMHSTAIVIEMKAQECASTAFTQAMAKEQTLMRRKARPRGPILPPSDGPMSAKSAESHAGRYAVCAVSGTGRLSAIGKASVQCDETIAQLTDGTFASFRLLGKQRLAIGICCRYLKRWIEPVFLPYTRDERVPAEDGTADE